MYTLYRMMNDLEKTLKVIIYLVSLDLAPEVTQCLCTGGIGQMGTLHHLCWSCCDQLIGPCRLQTGFPSILFFGLV
jgi:hypothetical protein